MYLDSSTDNTPHVIATFQVGTSFDRISAASKPLGIDTDHQVLSEMRKLVLSL